MKKLSQKIEIGDLVQCNNWQGKPVGIVKADARSYWCIKGCFDVDNRIVHEEDITIIKKHVVPKKYLKNLK